jgi:hypothetical protein
MMPSPGLTHAVSLVLSLVVAAVATALMWRQAGERRSRGDDLSPADERHFQRQDGRRALGAAVMLLLAVGLSVGSRIPHKAAGHSNPLFLVAWLNVFLLIFVLLGLTLADLLATRAYARRHRRALLHERLKMMRDEARRRVCRQNRGNDWTSPGRGFPH